MIILYNPPSSASRKPILPMSLLALGAVLEGAHDYAIVDGNVHADPVAALCRVVNETHAQVLGVTVMPGPQLGQAVPTCRQIKALYPDLKIVWGGYFPSQHYEVCLNADCVDFVVRGYGEMVFRGLCDALAGQGDPTTMPGLAYRRGDTGEIVSQGVAQLPDPDRLPRWSYDRIDVERYVRRTFLGKRTLPHHSSYGCPFGCSFCAVVNMCAGRWAAESPERMAGAVLNLVRGWGADSIEFDDNNFFVSEERTAEFAERIMDWSIHWWGEARIDTLLRYDERTWRLMQACGLKMVFLGAETGSDDTLKRMNKGGQASTEQALEIARKMACYGMVPEMSFVLGNPPDPEADTKQTISFIRRIKEANPATEVILYLYTPVPSDGELYRQAEASGFGFPKTLDEWISPQWAEFSQRRSADLPWLPRRLVGHIHDFQQVLNAYYPTVTDPRLTGARRFILRGLSGWRYHRQVYGVPLELRALDRLLGYQRPETSGF